MWWGARGRGGGAQLPVGEMVQGDVSAPLPPARALCGRAGGKASGGGGKNRVYVHNLDWAVTWQELKAHFKSAGEVVRADVLMKPNGQSKGCGLVEFATAADANNAIRTLNDTQLGDRPILVREVRASADLGAVREWSVNTLPLSSPPPPHRTARRASLWAVRLSGCLAAAAAGAAAPTSACSWAT